MAAACLDALGPDRRGRHASAHGTGTRSLIRARPASTSGRSAMTPTESHQLDQVDDGAFLGTWSMIEAWSRSTGCARGSRRHAEPRRAGPQCDLDDVPLARGHRRRLCAVAGIRVRRPELGAVNRRARSRGERRPRSARRDSAVHPTPAAPSSPARCRPSSLRPRAPDAPRCAHRIRTAPGASYAVEAVTASARDLGDAALFTFAGPPGSALHLFEAGR